MTAMAARSMGYRVHVLDPDANCAARPVVDRVVVAAFDDPAGAAELARECDVVTLEIEQIAPAALAAACRACAGAPGRRDPRAWCRIARGRSSGSPTRAFPIGPYRVVRTADELADAMRTLGARLFVKACHGGYDGRSQLRLDAGADAADAFAVARWPTRRWPSRGSISRSSCR